MAVGLLLMGAACSPAADPPPAPEPATSTPAQWFAARNDAQRQGTGNLAAFYDGDVVLDHRALGPGIAVGHEAALAVFHETWARDFLTRSIEAAPFLAVDAAASPERVATGAPTGHRRALFLSRMGPEGAVRETLAQSELTWRALRPADSRIRAVHTLAAAHAQAWSGRSGTAAASLYAAEARVQDTLLGVDASGREIPALVDRTIESGGLPGVTLASLPDLGGPAVFAAGLPHTAAPMDVIAVQLASPADCPGPVLVELRLDSDGLITHEERFHRLADLRRCWPDRVLPAAWWDDLTVPEPVPSVPTGTVALGDVQVALHNGTPGLEGLLRWGLGRFVDAGLELPHELTRVTFHERSLDMCRGKDGIYLGDEIILCLTANTSCVDSTCRSWRPWARAVLLHELGHVWMAEHTPGQVCEAFIDRAGLAAWASSSAPWGQRGTELAAETLTWGLMDEPYRINLRIAERTCAELADLYEILTGGPPRAGGYCAEPPMPG